MAAERESSTVSIQPYDPPDSRLTLGQTNQDASDLILPRIKVVQAMSAEASRDEDPAKVGDFYNTLTSENYGDKLRFVPILAFKQRVFLVRQERREKIEAVLGVPLSEGDGLKCRSLDTIAGSGEPGGECTTCPLSVWDGNIPPLCSETYNFASINELGELIILSFAKSSAKTGKRLNSMLRMRPGAPWASTYEASTRKEKNDRGTFAVPEVKVVGPTPTELLKVAHDWASQLAGTVLDVTPEAEETEVPDSPLPF